ncbi:MAG: zinc ribbon domain-containing protein [Oscillospiraceae bacterium]|jgi:hypothetical protein|nr:zinc ribbon domain-containing protein [Oscillospiraceae bacterium]
MAFNSTRFVPTLLTDFSDVASTVQMYFQGKGYTVEVTESSYGCFISLTKGGMFKSVLGMKTSLNIDIKKINSGVSIDAKVGILGQQLIPSLVFMFVAWPVMLTQISGLVQQAKLDNEALDVIENAIRAIENGSSSGVGNSRQFCTQCGADITAGSAFCSACGEKQ